MFRILMY